MLILVGPSASGKTEIAHILIKKYGMQRMVTYTTRSKRVGEYDKVSYNFITEDEFMKLKSNDEFVETVNYNGNYYGTRKSDVSFDKIVILEPLGLKSFAQVMPDEIVSFYLNVREVERINRMIYRQDEIDVIDKRVENDRIVFKNVEYTDYDIVNEDVALDDLADQIYELYINRIRSKKMKVLVETSARHVHITEEALKVLFGETGGLTFKKALSQPGQFACEERVTIVGPKKSITGVSILGPCRKQNQVEVSATDARSIGLDVFIRESGDVAATPGCMLVGPCGEVVLNEGVIVAKRHIHMRPEDAIQFGLVDKQIVSVKVSNDVRSLIYGDVVVRVRDDFALAMHIDTDESNAGFVGAGVFGEIIK